MEMGSYFHGFYYRIADDLETTRFHHASEKISTQNGPPKKINKIIFISFGGRKEKNYFFVCISDISPHVLTQILIERAHWMQN